METALSWLCIVSTLFVVMFAYIFSQAINWLRLLTKAYMKKNELVTTDKKGNEVVI